MSGEHQPLIERGGKSVRSDVTLYILYCVAVAVLSSFQFGWAIGVVNLPAKTFTDCETGAKEEGKTEDLLPRCIATNDNEWAVVVSIAAIGGMIGGLISGYISNHIGRRSTIFFNNMMFIISSLLLSFAANFYMLVAGRFFAGIGIGIASGVVPVYIGEISTTNLKGPLGTVNQLLVTVGILVSQLCSIPLSDGPGWRWLFGIPAAISIIQMILSIFTAESPAWLVGQQRFEHAEDNLRRLRGTESVGEELAHMKEEDAKKSSTDNYSIPQLIGDATLRRALVICVVLQICQQLSGINVVFYYSNEIFSGVFGDDATAITVTLSSWNVLLTIVAVWLMRFFGRRTLLLFGSAAMAVASALFVVSFSADIDILSVVAGLLFVASFAVALGPIPWILFADLLPTHAIGAGSSIGVGINWLSNFAVAQLFPLAASEIGKNYAFLCFAVILALFFSFIYFFVPETKGKTVEQVAEDLRQNKRS